MLHKCLSGLSTITVVAKCSCGDGCLWAATQAQTAGMHFIFSKVTRLVERLAWNLEGDKKSLSSWPAWRPSFAFVSGSFSLPACSAGVAVIWQPFWPRAGLSFASQPTSGGPSSPAHLREKGPRIVARIPLDFSSLNFSLAKNSAQLCHYHPRLGG